MTARITITIAITTNANATILGRPHAWHLEQNPSIPRSPEVNKHISPRSSSTQACPEIMATRGGGEGKFCEAHALLCQNERAPRKDTGRIPVQLHVDSCVFRKVCDEIPVLQRGMFYRG